MKVSLIFYILLTNALRSLVKVIAIAITTTIFSVHARHAHKNVRARCTQKIYTHQRWLDRISFQTSRLKTARRRSYDVVEMHPNIKR